MLLLFEKITGTHISKTRLSLSVFIIISNPIPLRSPEEKPITGFCNSLLIIIVIIKAVKIGRIYEEGIRLAQEPVQKLFIKDLAG